MKRRAIQGTPGNGDERFSAGLDVLVAGLQHVWSSPTAEKGQT
jgi:hypothetical protein